MVCSRYASRAPVTQRRRELPVAHERWAGLVLGLRPPVENGVLSDSKEVWEHHPNSECPSRTPMVAEVRPKRSARVQVLIWVDPHKASVASAVVDEALGEPRAC